MNNTSSLHTIRNYVFSNAAEITRKIVVYTATSAIFVIIFQSAIESIFFNGTSTILDQIAVLTLFTTALLIQLSKDNIHKYFLILGGIVAYLILISVFQGRNHNIVQVIIQSFLHVQLFLVLISLFIISKKFPGFIRKVFIGSILVSIVGAVLQLTTPNLFIDIFTPSEQMIRVTDRGDFRLWGFQRNPNRIGILFSFLAILLIMKKEIVKNYNSYIVLLTLSIVIVVLSGSRSAILFLAFALIFSEIKIKKKVFFASILTIVLFVSGVLDYVSRKTASNIETVNEISVDESNYIRWLMIYYGTEIALNNFPVGTGAATFGTAFSYNADVYNEIGIAEVPSVREQTGGVHDSNFGSIMGEFGFIGFLIFYGFTAFLIYKILNNSVWATFKNTNHFLYCMCLIVFSASFVNPTYLNSYFSVLFSLLILGFTEAEVIRNRVFKNLVSDSGELTNT